VTAFSECGNSVPLFAAGDSSPVESFAGDSSPVQRLAATSRGKQKRRRAAALRKAGFASASPNGFASLSMPVVILTMPKTQSLTLRQPAS